MLFIRSDVSTARTWTVLELSKEIEIDLIRRRVASAWNLPYGLHLNPPTIAPLLHGVGIITTNGTKPVNVIDVRNITLPEIPKYVSDTGELIWDCTDRKGNCVFIVNTSKSIVLTGFIGGRKFDLGNIVIEVGETLLHKGNNSSTCC